MQTATLSGGCFWCTEAIFKRLKGVSEVTSGYANSDLANPSYEQVCSGKTGAAEAIRVKFDPKLISFGKILEIFWHLHNPTQLNKQGNDTGTQYRSAVFYINERQRKEVESSKISLEKSKFYADPIVTKIEPLNNFYPAEDYHKNYYELNPAQPYCSLVIDPKIDKLIREYGQNVKEEYLS